MKPKLPLFVILSVLLLSLFLPSAARADGIIIPIPPICDPGPCPPVPPMEQLVVRYHHVTVTIEDQVAVTHVDQVFYNPNSWTIEGTYMFPIPLEAAVTSFTLWMDGKPVEGKVLDAKQARQTYEDIVQRMRDPALLEYANRGAVQASLYPIEPKSERRIELEYTQALVADNGLVQYVYPLNTEKFSAKPLENVSVTVDIRSNIPIRAVYSPSHTVDVTKDGDRHVTVGYEATNVKPDTDFSLFYSLGESEAFHVLTFRDPSDSSDPDGFFLALLAPRPAQPSQVLAKDVLLVLDHSGSMDGEKFQQAKQALRYILNHLNSEDRFNIISFGSAVDSYATGLRPASETAEAMPWIDRLSAMGSTDINRALLEAASMADRQHPTYLIFLTDGLPTVGETDSQKILNNFAEAAPDSLRLFAFGVGYDVDTFLLDSLAQEHHGASTYVQPGQSIDEILSGFYAKISTPVLTNLELDFGSISAYDIYPLPLPDLFSGSQIVVLGRYRQGGTTTVILKGLVNDQQQSFQFPEQIFVQDSLGQSEALKALPRLWTTRKIGYLLNQIRLKGPDQETIDQIVKLSVRYGIVTPYTSYLVTEDMTLGAEAQNKIAREQYSQMATAPAPATTGQDAVQKAAEQGSLAGAESAQGLPTDAENKVRVVGARTFVYSNGVWIDTAFDPQSMQTVKVSFLSKDYFALTQAYPDLAAAFALGRQVIAISNGTAYEVVGADVNTGPVEIPPTPTAGAVTSRPTETPAAVSQVPTATPTAGVQPTETPPASSASPCGALLLPLALLGLVLLFRKR